MWSCAPILCQVVILWLLSATAIALAIIPPSQEVDAVLAVLCRCTNSWSRFCMMEGAIRWLRSLEGLCTHGMALHTLEVRFGLDWTVAACIPADRGQIMPKLVRPPTLPGGCPAPTADHNHRFISTAYDRPYEPDMGRCCLPASSQALPARCASCHNAPNTGVPMQLLMDWRAFCTR